MGHKEIIRDYLLTAEVGDITPFRGKLDPEFKAKWVAALRDGTRQQGNGLLKFQSDQGETRYCCLGVACEVAEIEGYVRDDGATTFDGSTYSLSLQVQDKLNLSDVGNFQTTLTDGDVFGKDDRVPSGDRFTCSLAAMNDEYDFTFPMIADFIEKHF